MSNTGDQNTPFSAPQPPGYGPAPAPGSGAAPGPAPGPAAQPPVPPQPQPYAQPNPYAQQGPPGFQAPSPAPPPASPQGPGGYGYPAPSTPGAPTGSPGMPGAAYGAPPGGGPGDGAGRGVSGWLWALGGAVAAAAVGGSVLFATGAFSSEPDPVLKGYAYRDDLCAATSLSPFENAHYEAKPSSGSTTGTGTGSSAPPNPQHSGAQLNSMDSMWCNITLTPQSTGTSIYPTTWLYTAATLHKKADPAPEFADMYRAYEKQETSVRYRVEPVSGIGDEAFLVSRTDAGSNSAYVILAARDGWLTYQSTWTSYTAGSNAAKAPSSSEIATMLETSAKETLQRLKNGGR
ncbi:hypothetical protein MUU72_28185 [Streptomyces sp. RS10V-4]|uniref:hypothetical protein n=1 Tax=Streptomyces rhizoryzae TaxID=2932493 RepID=UPI0020048684|nr:hypothetical protein [Streptomyces rhizoryzae]MCK7626930.1 hypothetical protein [Streptomyces rhizoryzae]